jgi:hypothetical protein
MRATLGYTGRFLQTKGWWPLLAELVRYMRAPKYAVHWFVDENLQAGVLEWHGKHPKREVRVTPRGWSALARQPMQPWRKRPSDDVRARITQKVLDEVMAEMEKQKAANAAMKRA